MFHRIFNIVSKAYWWVVGQSCSFMSIFDDQYFLVLTILDESLPEAAG